MTTEAHATDPDVLPVGCEVCVRDNYQGNWSGGFDVAGVEVGGYLIRRRSDGRVFAETFPFADVRRERRRDPLRDQQRSHLDRRQSSDRAGADTPGRRSAGERLPDTQHR